MIPTGAPMCSSGAAMNTTSSVRGKRNNVATPTYIRPLDMGAEIEAGRKEEHRFHITPKHTVIMKGRKVNVEQRVECGRGVTAVYSGV